MRFFCASTSHWRLLIVYGFMALATWLLSAWSFKAQAQQIAQAPTHSQTQIPQRVEAPTRGAPSQRQIPTLVLAGQSKINLIASTEYWIDDSKDTTPSALQARASAGLELFKLSKATDAHKIHGKVLWLRFEIKANEQRSRWLLEVGSPLVDDVRLYWRDNQGAWMSLRAGDAVPRSQWPVPTRLPTFTLPSDTAEPVQYLLRVENARFPASLPLYVFRDTAYLAEYQADLMLLGVLVGLISLMLLASSALVFKRREIAFSAYFAYALALGLFVITNTGLAPLYFWNNSPILADRLNYILAALTAALGPALVRMIVQPVMRTQATHTVILLHAMAMLFCAALELWSPSSASYLLLNLGTLMSIALVYGLVSLTWQRGEIITRWVALCFAPVAFSALPLILRNLGAIPNSWLTQYVVPVAAAIELPLLFYALLARSNMRKEVLARAAGLPSQDALTGLPNMRIFLEHLHGSITRANRFGHPYGLFLVELTNHAWFAKEHGADMANRALILTSTRLQQVTRDVDTVSRLDESHFVILVEGACSARQLTKLAARVSASGLAPTEILPVGASLRLSVCCALMPTEASQEAGDDAQSQLGWLLTAAEALPDEQRKLVRSIGF